MFVSMSCINVSFKISKNIPMNVKALLKIFPVAQLVRVLVCGVKDCLGFKSSQRSNVSIGRPRLEKS